MDNLKGYPLEIVDVDAETTAAVNKDRPWPMILIAIGPHRYIMPKRFEEEAAKIYNMEVRPTDTWVITTMRSGTTMMQELIWQITHDFDYENSKLVPLPEKFPFLEHSSLVNPEFVEKMAKEKPEFEAKYRAMRSSEVDKLINEPISTPRFIKTHLALSLLPPDLLDTAKVVYVVRNPLDAAVSLYHLLKLFRTVSLCGSFSSFWQNFINGRLSFLPYFPHLKEAWSKRDHPNMLFLFYEDVIKDLPNTIRRVASFLGKEITDGQVSKLAEHLRIENCKKNPAMNNEGLAESGWLNSKDAFVREGKSGNWRDYFDADMTRQAEQWIADNLKDTDLRFPQY